MARLKLFGGLRIEGEAGPLTGRASQKRRLALLALLASPPARPIARDKLTAALWPESTDERARRSLSSALYDLRVDLGEDAVLAAGEDLTLNLDVVPTDVAAFARALERGDLEGAVASYSGPFLDGFFIDDADDFERWAEGERQRYAHEYRDALLRLAEHHAAAGNTDAAAAAWHRLAAADPYSARVAVGYMTALEAVGDRAGALRFARVHETLLRDELGAEPSPEVSALADRLRESPAPARLAVKSGSDASAPVAPTPSGTIPPPGVRPGHDSGRKRAPRWPPNRRTAVGAVLAVMLVVVLVGISRARPGDPGGPLGAGEGIGLAVLPFQNLSGSSEMDSFSDGLTEELISGLGKVSQLRIPSRTTMVLYQGRGIPPAEIARELGVEYWLEGTVRSEGARLRITANLVEARTGAAAWRDRYDLQMVSVFDAQEEIAQAVVRAIAPALAGTTGPLVEPTTRDLAAYRLYLRGRRHWYGRSPADFRSALSDFNRALEQDPEYALAYSAIADVYNLLGAYDYGLERPGDVLPLARTSAERALRLNPELPEAHAALANVLFNYDWDLAAAEQRYRRAVRLNPGYVMARHWLSLLLATEERHEEALAEIYIARQLDPRSPVLNASLARHHYYMREYELAVEEFDDTLDMDPSFGLAYLGAGLALVQLGEHDRAIASYQRAADLMGGPSVPVLALTAHAEGMAGRRDRAVSIQRQLLALREAGTYVAPHYLAIVAIGIGELERAMDHLEESLAERSAALLYSRIDPIVDPLRSEPRFLRIIGSVQPKRTADAAPGRSRPVALTRTGG